MSYKTRPHQKKCFIIARFVLSLLATRKIQCDRYLQRFNHVLHTPGYDLTSYKFENNETDINRNHFQNNFSKP